MWKAKSNTGLIVYKTKFYLYKYFHWNVHSGVGWNTSMMTSSNGIIFHVTGHLCGEVTGRRWIPRTKANDAEFNVFFDLRLINGWVNNGEAGDSRRHCAHCDVTVMQFSNQTWLRNGCVYDRLDFVLLFPHIRLLSSTTSAVRFHAIGWKIASIVFTVLIKFSVKGII